MSLELPVKPPPSAKLVGFLYMLMRDHVPLGITASLTKQAEKLGPDTPVYSNPHLASYAEEIARKLS